jgi:hypothetical protein
MVTRFEQTSVQPCIRLAAKAVRAGVLGRERRRNFAAGYFQAPTGWSQTAGSSLSQHNIREDSERTARRRVVDGHSSRSGQFRS